MATATRRTFRTATKAADEITVDEDGVIQEETSDVLSGLDLLSQFEGSSGPSDEQISARPAASALPAGDYVARLKDFTVEAYDGLPRFVTSATAQGVITSKGVEDKWVGRYLPRLSVNLTPELNDKGNRRDIMFWLLADAILTEETRRDIQKANKNDYAASVSAVLDSLREAIDDGMAYFAMTTVIREGTERSSGLKKDYANSRRVYMLPEDLDPIVGAEEA